MQNHPIKIENRNSSFELLRIVAMLMIVIYHFSCHGNFNFPDNSITLNRLWCQFILIFGGLGDDIFVLISGYFLVKSEGLNFKRLFNLWLRILFYSVVIFYLFILFNIEAFSFFNVEAFSIKNMLKSFMPITCRKWWFATTYFVLYLIHPYINILLRSFSKEEYKKFLAAVFLYWCIIPTFLKSDFDGSRLVDFVCLYSLAGYFRLWGNNLGNKKFIFYGICLIGLNCLYVICFDIVGMKFPIFLPQAPNASGVKMMDPLTILASIFLLIGFKNLHIKHNKIINIISSATFGVYLIHEHEFIRPFLWLGIFKNYTFQDSPYLIPYSIAIVILVYIVCTLIELIRSKIFKLISCGKLS